MLGKVRILLVGLAFMAILNFFDPYSFGQVGGDLLGEPYPWQRIGLVLSLLLLGTTAFEIVRARLKEAKSFFLGEIGIFVLLNVIYVVRDGSDRFSFGFSSAPDLLFLVLGGVLIRFSILLLMNNEVRRSHMPSIG